MSVPISLAETNGKLRTGQKAPLADILAKETGSTDAIHLSQGTSCLLIDGMALVATIGKPSNAP